MTTADTVRPALRRVLTQDAGISADAHAIAAAALRAYERLAQQVAPLIGEAGLNAVCARSLHLMQREFSWLAPAGSAEPRDTPFTHVRVSLERQDPAVATNAAIAVLATFGELLASFIGESLTTRLLPEAWPDGFSDDTTQETTNDREGSHPSPAHRRARAR
jgi:hypothetical protein